MNEILIGDKFLLRTRDDLGGLLPKEDWIKVTWNGRALVDEDGCCWNEWLDDEDGDIIPLTEL